ncbi:hypothetical protein CFIMG_005055RA [Ceratocystis fimbriata CBS 114723]|uniref:Uncharacterized protein n=1 Tax=Ceratocystis fimbriata CBS 114723 TaxID=1035309 RepID=A0A2C5X6S4_9PEZI|nr:hypothetical protein CFIMG_005055RA [Ceratocystis fimbriata CBS 114723]
MATHLLFHVTTTEEPPMKPTTKVSFNSAAEAFLGAGPDDGSEVASKTPLKPSLESTRNTD